MAKGVALNAAVHSKSQIYGFMRGKLKDYNRKSQFENDLQIDETKKRVVIALLDSAQKMDDEEHCSRTAHDHAGAAGKDICYRAIHPQTLTKSVCQLQNELH